MTEQTTAGTATSEPVPGDAQRDPATGPLRSVVIFNPVRVDNVGGRHAEVEDALAAAGWPEPGWLETTREDPGTGQARHAVADGAEVVFVSGGDGTVRACAEGMVGSAAALAVLPAGTSNLLATNLGLPSDPGAGVRLATERGRRRIDVGELDGHVFTVTAGMGFDAAMVRDAPRRLKSVVGPLAYVVSAVRHVTDRSMSVEIVLDDGPALHRRARSVLAANVGRLPGGTRMLADADPDDGLLDIAVLTPHGPVQWLRTGWAVLRRRERIPSMELHRAAHAIVTSDRDQPREVDGDDIEPGRVLDVRVRADALWVCVHQPDRTADLADQADGADGADGADPDGRTARSGGGKRQPDTFGASTAGSVI